MSALFHVIEQWKGEASKAGSPVSRVVLGYEAGRDGFWIARTLREYGIEVYVMHPSSIAVERRGRRAKTDRIDIDMLLGSLFIRFGIADFRPRLKKAMDKLEKLCGFDGRPLPPKTMEKLRRLMDQHRLLSEQMRQIEEARQQVVMVPDPDRVEKMIQLLVSSSVLAWRRQRCWSTKCSLANSGTAKPTPNQPLTTESPYEPGHDDRL